MTAPAIVPPIIPHLTRREEEVLWLYVVTGSRKVTGRTLGIADGTVAVHLARILSKTGCTSAGEVAVRLGWLHRPRRRALAPSSLGLWGDV